jgi:hypothetical protein
VSREFAESSVRCGHSQYAESLVPGGHSQYAEMLVPGGQECVLEPPATEAAGDATANIAAAASATRKHFLIVTGLS